MYVFRDHENLELFRFNLDNFIKLLNNNHIINRKVGLEFNFLVEKHMNMLHYRLALFPKVTIYYSHVFNMHLILENPSMLTVQSTLKYSVIWIS